MSHSREQRKPEIIGWRETVALPELGIPTLRAKVDTGARTAALHVVDLQPLERDGVPWVGFRVPLGRNGGERQCVPVYDRRAVKNTSGVAEERWIIHTTLLLGRHKWHIQVSLANRANMTFGLILGRATIRGRGVLVDPGRSFLAGSPSTTDPHPSALSVASARTIPFEEHSS